LALSTNSCLVDANVWLALLVKEHVHHFATGEWFDAIAPREAALCRVVQLTLLRLLGTRAIMGGATMSATEAWRRITELLDDERIEFLPEPPDLDVALTGLFRYTVPTQNLIMDAYLAAFAMSAGRKIVTWDRGFVQFQGLEVKLLTATA
jgi:uncharacterized protein